MIPPNMFTSTYVNHQHWFYQIRYTPAGDLLRDIVSKKQQGGFYDSRAATPGTSLNRRIDSTSEFEFIRCDL